MFDKDTVDAEWVKQLQEKHKTNNSDAHLRFIVKYMGSKGITLSQLTHYIESEPMTDGERIQLHRRKLANIRNTRERFAIGKEKARIERKSS